MDHANPNDMLLLKKEQKDAELDKKIEALKKKNEALRKRYQEVEEDKRAAQEGMVMQNHKGKVDALTITVKSLTDKRVVSKKGSLESNPKSLQNNVEGPSSIFSAGRGKRRQILITAPANTKGKRSVSERVEMRGVSGQTELKNNAENKVELDTGPGKDQHPNAKRTSQHYVGGQKQEYRFQPENAHHGLTRTEEPDMMSHVDLEIPMSSEEKLEYLRWKKEREQIDRERVARHKTSQGQWRRAWDVDKPEMMLSGKMQGTTKRETQSKGGRNGRRGTSRSLGADSKGAPVSHSERGKKKLPVVGSKVTGKDRLTGRARRWDAKEESAQLQGCPHTSLEGFLEELDALCNNEINILDTEIQDSVLKETSKGSEEAENADIFPSADPKGKSHVPSELASSPSKSAEKKVRFSNDLIHEASETYTGVVENTTSSLKGTIQTKAFQDDQRGSDVEVINTQKQNMLLTSSQSNTPSQSYVQERKTKALADPLKSVLTEGTESEPKDQPFKMQNGNEASASTEVNLHPMKNGTYRDSGDLINSGLSVEFEIGKHPPNAQNQH